MVGLRENMKVDVRDTLIISRELVLNIKLLATSRCESRHQGLFEQHLWIRGYNKAISLKAKQTFPDTCWILKNQPLLLLIPLPNEILIILRGMQSGRLKKEWKSGRREDLHPFALIGI